MKPVIVIFFFALGIQGAMSENDVSGNDCFVPAVCSKGGYSKTAWMSISRPVCEAGIATKGVQGEVGPKGESGPVGLKGEDGPQGKVGQAGPKGDDGTRGEKGSKGEVGVVGPKGDHGPQGKIGQPGPHGENGTRGINGSNGGVGAKGEKGTKGEQASGNSLVIKNIIKVLCPVKHENKCFLPVLGSKVDYNGGVATCESFGGLLANIYNQTNMNDIMKYIRENQKIDSSSPKSFHLGMKYNPKAANKLNLRDGTDAPAALKWRKNFPTPNAGYTGVVLQVDRDQSTVWQYLANVYPTGSGTHYVLCEIE